MVIPLDDRHVEILRMLFQSPEPLPAKVVAQNLHLTPRVVRSRLRFVEEWLKTKDIELHQKPGIGISLDIPESQRARLWKEIDQLIPMRSYRSSPDRIHLILFDLLTRSNALTIKEIQYQLGVSRTTVLKDLEDVEVWLNSFHINLVRRQNFGCFIQGSEINVRQSIVSLLIESIGEIDLLSIFGNLDDSTAIQVQKGKDEIPTLYLKSLELGFFDTLVDQIQNLTHKTLTDRARMILALQMAISINRLKDGMTVDMASAELELLRSRTDFHFSAALIERIRRRFKITFPEPEIAYLMIRIMEAEIKRPVVNTAIIQDMHKDYDENITTAVDALLDQAVLYLHPALRLDQELKESLISHLASLMESPIRYTKNKDPLLEDIRLVYPEAYKVTHDCMAEVNKKLSVEIPEDEIGYMTMHLVAAMERLRMLSRKKKKVIIICNAGVATSKLLASRVATEFPEIEIKGMMSYLEYKNNDIYDFDYVITTIPIPSWNKPAIVVGPLLDRNDVLRIRSALNLVDRRDLEQKIDAPRNKQAALSDLLTRDMIALQANAQTWQDVVDLAGNLLVNSSAAEPNYVNAMKSVHEEFGPFMVIMPGIALLHAFPEDGVKRLCISMVTLRRPVAFGHKKFDPVFLAFALGATDNYTHLRSLSELIEMVKNAEVVGILRSTSLKSKVLNIIAKFSKGKDA